jgi:hypothetical protein
MSESSEELYPIEMVYHHNRYGSTLVDVDGNVLVGKEGRRLNVFQEELKDMMISKEIRFMHYLSKEPTYSYFITTVEQLGRFHIQRTEGSPKFRKQYHVYPDY